MKDKSVTANKLKQFQSFYPSLEDYLANADGICDAMRILKRYSSYICCSHLTNVAYYFRYLLLQKNYGLLLNKY